MRITFSRTDPVRWPGDALVLGLFEGSSGDDPLFQRFDAATGGALTRAVRAEAFTAESGSTLLLPTSDGLAAERLLLVGLGARGGQDPTAGRRLGGTAARRLLKREVGSVGILPVAGSAEPAMVSAIADGFLNGAAGIDAFKTGPEKRRDPYGCPYRSLSLLAGDRVTRAHREAVRRAEAMAVGLSLARRLVNTPANRMTPRQLASEARRAGRASGVRVEVWDEARIRREGMGALLAVSAGSSETPRFIVMRYRPEDPRAAASPPLALVGKGITFDTGGISIKPAKGMEEMKADMAGAAAVIGALTAIGLLRPEQTVLGVVPTCENMPSGSATRPGDVIETWSGQTIEVLNTDAEGRLVLADALAWTAARKPAAMVDIATLTGACVVALGHVYAGLMGNDEAWVERVRSTAAEEGEKLWPLPMDPEYDELVASDIADVRNTGKDQPGVITAAKLLERFVGEVPWAHLDIAGTEWRKESKPWTGAGPTGFGVRTFVGLALRGDMPGRD